MRYDCGARQTSKIMFGSTILTQNLGVCLLCIAFPYKNSGQQCARVGNQSGGRRTQGNPHPLNLAAEAAAMFPSPSLAPPITNPTRHLSRLKWQDQVPRLVRAPLKPPLQPHPRPSPWGR